MSDVIIFARDQLVTSYVSSLAIVSLPLLSLLENNLPWMKVFVVKHRNRALMVSVIKVTTRRKEKEVVFRS